MNNIDELKQKLAEKRAEYLAMIERRRVLVLRNVELCNEQREVTSEIRSIGDERALGQLKSLRIECEGLEVLIQDSLKPPVVWQDGKADPFHIVDRVTAKRIYVRRRGGWTTDMYTRHGRPIARMYQPRYIDVKATLGADYDPGPE